MEGLTHHVDCARLACQAARVVLDDVAGFVDALDGARFNIELIVAEALSPSRHRTVSHARNLYNRPSHAAIRHLPLFRREVPVRDSSVTQVLAHQDVNASYDVPHHTVSHDDNLLEPNQDLTDLLRREPAHITAPRHVRCIMSNATSRRQRRKQRSAVRTERTEWGVEIERRDVTRVAVLVADECVRHIRKTVSERLRWLESHVGEEACIVRDGCREVGRTVMLQCCYQQIDHSLGRGLQACYRMV